jgi:serine/threonine-protein kinase mTOR
MSSPAMMHIVTGLKSRNQETRAKSAKELHHYVINFELFFNVTQLFYSVQQVTTELREVSVEEWTAFMDEFNKHIHDMVTSKDTHEKLGGISAMSMQFIFTATVKKNPLIFVNFYSLPHKRRRRKNQHKD